MKILLEILKMTGKLSGKYYYVISIDGKRKVMSCRPYTTINGATKAGVLVLEKLGYKRDLTPERTTSRASPRR